MQKVGKTNITQQPHYFSLLPTYLLPVKVERKVWKPHEIKEKSYHLGTKFIVKSKFVGLKL